MHVQMAMPRPCLWHDRRILRGVLYKCKQRTRLNAPLASDLHRFFAPLCVLSLGNPATAEVENSRVVPRTRAKIGSMVTVPGGQTETNV